MSSSFNPYMSLPAQCFWRTAVAQNGPFKIASLWSPKFDIQRIDNVITAGSCFAQHIGRRLRARGFNWLDAEPPPPGLSPSSQTEFNFGIFSFRTGNIYTAAVLRQWLFWATNTTSPPADLWEEKGRYFDPMRPQIEPNGYASPDEVFRSRQVTLRAILKALKDAQVFVFTMGLTEAWIDRRTGLTYSSCPGTIAGRFEPEHHAFRNFTYVDVLEAMTDAMDVAKTVNPDLRFLLTVSPVPLTATAQPGDHVLAATTYSKSTLRAVAGDLARTRDDTDYFPSYELITAVPFRGMFFEPNLRTIEAAGVDFVMNHFFAALNDTADTVRSGAEPLFPTASEAARDVVCEEMVLDQFNEH